MSTAVDRTEKIEAILPKLDAMVEKGLVTTGSVRIILSHPFLSLSCRMNEPNQRTLGYRSLRNVLFHYAVGKRMASHLSPGLPLFGLVEAHTSGRSFAAVADDVEMGLDRVSGRLRSLLPRIPPPRGTP